ncbi:MAG: amylo-alpha-1,6-glucosidase [Lentisphaeria bacterium]
MTVLSQTISEQQLAAAPLCLATGDATLDRAFQLALDDLGSNIVPHRLGLLDQAAPVLRAGQDYADPWTRDAAINTWNGAGLLHPEVMKHTLLAVLKRRDDGEIVITDDQEFNYWDIIIWAIGGWWQYLYTGDREFLELAFTATRNTITHFEATEFDAATGLFRGAACYGDGDSAYPDRYAQPGGTGGIRDWARLHPELAATPGGGLPMQVLSTNGLYYHVYGLLGEMAGELGLAPDAAWATKAAALKAAINARLWLPEAGRYRYFIDPFGGCDHQEGLGHAFALLFGVASPAQAQAVLQHQRITAWGIPCVWPTFDRYTRPDGMSFGRHSGTVWPHIQAFWADAALRHGRADRFELELRQLATLAVAHGEFREIYHPVTGEPYGGVQQRLGVGDHEPWESCRRQTWSATGYLRMVLMGLCGMDFTPAGIRFAPHLPAGLNDLELTGLPYRRMTMNLTVKGAGANPGSCTINGRRMPEPFLPASGDGIHDIVIELPRPAMAQP